MEQVPAWITGLNAFSSVVLVGVTAAYVRLTAKLAESARASALASQKAAEAAELHLKATTTPVVVWTHLRMFENPEDRVEAEFRLQNVGPTAAIKVFAAPIRYPFDGPGVPLPWLPTAPLIGGGGAGFPAGDQMMSYVLPDKPYLLDDEQWRFALGTGNYGLVVMYSDVSNRWWRTELRKNGTTFLLELTEPPDPE